jgi:hypothetical protein
MDLVMEIDNFFNHDLCKKIIEKHDSDIRLSSKEPLVISKLNEWSFINKELSVLIEKAYSKYIEWLETKIPVPPIFSCVELSEFRIEKHSAPYEIHPCTRGGKQLLCTFFIMLNEPTEDAEVDFLYKKVRTTTGKLIMFPTTWTSYHKAKNSKDKYVIMGTFHSTA